MLDSIHVGMTGLAGYARGLRVIANNTANLHTPGFKGSRLQFTDLFYASAGTAGGSTEQLGHGLGTAGTQLDFRAGELRQTGNDFDLALDGEGLFTLQAADGGRRYARAGQFEFNADGVFIDRIDGSRVLGLDAAGNEVDIRLDGLRSSAGQATATARFTGNLSSTVSEHTVNSVKVHDALGEEHVLSLKFTRDGAAEAASWKLELFDGATSVGTGQLVFEDGRPSAATARPVFTYAPAGRTPVPITFDFSSDVTSFASGNLSSLALSGQDGYAPGALTKLGFDARGALVATYTNGQMAQGARLLLGRFLAPDAVQAVGGNRFVATSGSGWQAGGAGDGGFGAVRAGVLEVSNVDLSREFSDLVILQRGYQASSQVISTANDMLQELFRMKAK
ncbi:MAG TPA: flagellar hook-basal body complex protein [Ramlibacter sp.]|nr:flagellar hook-basal body complex protein [Ramlibacter sp.]